MLRAALPALLASLAVLVAPQDKPAGAKGGAGKPGAPKGAEASAPFATSQQPDRRAGRPAPLQPLAPSAAGAPQSAKPAIDALGRQRTIVNMIVLQERVHRERATRLERLARIYEEKHAADRLRVAIVMRHTEEQGYQNTLSTYARDLGPELYARVRAALDAGPGSAPPLRPIPPEPPRIEKPESPDEARARSEAEGQEPDGGDKDGSKEDGR